MTALAGRRLSSRAAHAVTLFVVAFLGLVGEAQGYLLGLSSDSGISRWPLESLADGRIPWRLSNRLAGNVSGERSVLDTLSESFQAWESLGSSEVKFAFRGQSGANQRNSRDGINLISVAPDESLPTGVLAVTYVSTRADRIEDSDILFNRAVSFTTKRGGDAGRFDLQSVATHEIGHFFGLGHTGLTRATMAPALPAGEIASRTPESDDQIAAALLYPTGGFLSGTGSIQGRVLLDGRGVHLSHVVAATITGRIVASAITRSDGTYRIDGLPPSVYLVLAERLDGPVLPASVCGSTACRDAATTGYRTAFH